MAMVCFSGEQAYLITHLPPRVLENKGKITHEELLFNYRKNLLILYHIQLESP